MLLIMHLKTVLMNNKWPNRSRSTWIKNSLEDGMLYVVATSVLTSLIKKEVSSEPQRVLSSSLYIAVQTDIAQLITIRDSNSITKSINQIQFRLLTLKMLVSSLTKKILQGYSTSPLSLSQFAHIGSSESLSRSLNLHQYKHIKTGARIYHFENNDLEKAQASIIKTYPKNNKGAPHILEHLACCGSHKYPIRDPFFNMIKRSVNSYMNAWTGDDFTAYPFASPNPKDWLNLYHVYLDMTLRPILHPLDFRQQGWRYEINDEGKKTLKGIVLNQMKGAYQDSDRQLIMALNQELLRGTPYAYDSGGKPEAIVSLEYEELVDLHKHYYHPSNMSFFYYGKGNIKKELQILNEEYLINYNNETSRYQQIGFHPIPVQKRHIDIRTNTSECNNCSISYFLGLTQQINEVQTMTLRILSYLLLEKATSEVYKNFIETGIAQNMGFSGLNSGKFTTFTTTLKGIFPNYSPEQFQKQFQEMLIKLIQNNIDMERVHQFVHQFETSLRIPKDQNGIRVLEDTLYYMNHRLDLGGYLNPNPIINQVVQKMSDKSYLRCIIDRYFLKNNQVIVIRQLMAQTIVKQEQISSSLIVEDNIIKKTQEQLEKRQNQIPNNSVLPNLYLSDLVAPTRKESRLVETIKKNGKKYEHYHIKIDEDINFYKLVFSFDHYSKQFIHKVQLWIYSLNSTIATQTQSYRQLSHKLSIITAEFSVSCSLGKNDSYNIVFQWSCLNKNISQSFKIIEQLLFKPVFEKQRVLNLFKSFKNESIQSLIQNPMAQCQAECASSLTLASYISNSYQCIKESLKIVKQQNYQQMKEVSKRLLHCQNIKLIQHSKKNIENIYLPQMLLRIPAQLMNNIEWQIQYQSKAIVHNYGVGFCSQQYVGPKFLSQEHAQMNLLLQFLQQQYLHPRIREQNGAYGTSARRRQNGTIALASYLDPNPTQTFEIFDESIQDMLSIKQIEEGKFNQLKIMQLGMIDRIRTPQNEGVSEIIRGYSTKDFIQFRQYIKKAEFKDLIHVGAKYFDKQKKSRCVFAKECPPQFKEQKLKQFIQ